MNNYLIKILMLGSALTLSSCGTVKVHDHGYGPPPHAPAHGYRHKHHGHDLEFDSFLGVYVVVGLTSHYFIDGVFYKVTDHGWFSSHDIDKGWKAYKKDKLPGGLHKKYKYKDKDKHEKHGRNEERGKRGRHDDDHDD
jgi:hypothetical protein